MKPRVLALVAAVGCLLFCCDGVTARSFSPPGDERKPVAHSDVVTLEKPRILDTLATSATRLPFALHAPVATVVLDERPTFQWAGVYGANSYEITILDRDRGTTVASGTSLAPTWRPARPLPRGRTYTWQVVAVTSGRRIATEARFHIAAQSSVEGKTPLERGIALARLGALDDAERELAAAGADALLQQVRGWRPQRRRAAARGE